MPEAEEINSKTVSLGTGTMIPANSAGVCLCRLEPGGGEVGPLGLVSQARTIEPHMGTLSG